MTKENIYSIRQQIIEKDFTSLNNMQKKAVFSTEGPLLVLAGAGSGKTTVLVNRIANLIKYGKAYYSNDDLNDLSPYEEELLLKAASGEEVNNIDYLLKVNSVSPWQILAITFTNKAANELKSRIINKIGEDAEDIWASTFHSCCVRILRRAAERLGYTSDFTIYDTDDSKRVIKECMKELALSDKIIAPKSVIIEISNAKNSEIGPEEYLNENQYDFLKKSIGEIYVLYQKKLRASNAMDFDDLIYNTVKLFRQNSDILDYYQNKFRYILVDEYQDTNTLQYVFVSLLAGKYKNICVVGDDDQSIYRFRGATIENILSFEDEYSGSKVIRLEQNYRSTQTILDAANSVIAHNVQRKGKNLWTDNGKGNKIIYHNAEYDREEGIYVASNIQRMLNKGMRPSDFAILYRMNSQSNIIEQELVKRAISYKIIGGHKFYDRKEIKDALSYLCVIANPDDIVRLTRIYNEPKRGIGEASFDAVREVSDNLGIPILEVMLNADDYPKLSRASKKLKAFAEMINGFRDFAEVNSLPDLLSEVLDKSGYIESLNLDPDRKADRIENLDQLKNNIYEYVNNTEEPSLNDFLQNVALMTDIDNYNSEDDSVILMTVHAAKGLEFDTVFLVGMEENIFPSDISKNEAGGIEEERRLAYVAITRAKRQLFITNATQRMLFGMTRYNPVSMFVKEIPENLMENSPESKRKQTTARNDYNGIQSGYKSVSTHSFSSGSARNNNYGFSGGVTKPKPTASAVTYKVGDTVVSATFGEGVVLSVKPMGNDCMLEVAFVEGKTKKIMANYAKLEKKN